LVNSKVSGFCNLVDDSTFKRKEENILENIGQVLVEEAISREMG
jgi:hypothetical protein